MNEPNKIKIDFDVDEAFKKNAEEAERLAKEAEDAKNRKGTFEGGEKIEWVGLEENKYLVMRILGRPILTRKHGYEPKLILQSQILDDTGNNYFKCNWPYIEKDGKFVPDPNWILTKLYNKVMESKFRKYEDGHKNEKGYNGEYERVHQDTKIFKLVNTNTRPKDNFPKSFYPSKKVIMQGIVRGDSWCVENKHTKVLSAKISPYEFVDDKGQKQTYYFIDAGISFTAYNNMVKHFETTSGNWFKTDCIMIKVPDSVDGKKRNFEFYDKGDARYIKDKAILDLAVEGDLTSEELDYGVYDLDKIFKATSYRRLSSKLIGLFKLADAELKTSFTEELEELLKKEQAESDAEKNAKEEDEIASSQDISLDAPASDDFQPVAEEVDKNQIKVKCENIFPKWKELTDVDRNIIIESIWYFDGNVPVFNKAVDSVLCTDKACKIPGTDVATDMPTAIKKCPVCGVDY